MKTLIFGATGMVGQAVLRECPQAAEVAQIQTVVRTVPGQTDARLRDLVLPALLQACPGSAR